MNILEEMESVLEAAICAVEQEHAVADRFRLKGSFEWQEKLTTASYTPGTHEGHMLQLSWGNQDLPNGRNRVPFLLPHKKIYLKRIKEEVRLTALQRTLIVGRDQELRETGRNLRKPPRWAKVSTPLAVAIARKRTAASLTRDLTDGLEEKGAVLGTFGPMTVTQGLYYECNPWNGEETFNFGSSFPLAVMTSRTLVGRPLREVVDISGRVGKLIGDIIIENSSMDTIEDLDGEECKYPWISFRTQRLMRFARPPQGIESDPLKAWKAAAQRSQ